MNCEVETPYSILNVSKDATAKEIKKSYHCIALKYHPVKNRNLNAREQNVLDELMKKVNVAYKIIGDDESRNLYDQENDIMKIPMYVTAENIRNNELVYTTYLRHPDGSFWLDCFSEIIRFTEICDFEVQLDSSMDFIFEIPRKGIGDEIRTGVFKTAHFILEEKEF